MTEAYKAIDNATVEITTTTEPVTTVILHDRDEIQTKFDNIPGELAELQEQINIVNKRKARLEEILKVFGK